MLPFCVRCLFRELTQNGTFTVNKRSIEVVAGGAVFSAEHMLAKGWNVTGMHRHWHRDRVLIRAVNNTVRRDGSSVYNIMTAEAFLGAQVFFSNLMAQSAGNPINS